MVVRLHKKDIAAKRELVLHARLPIEPKSVNILTQMRREIPEDENLYDLARNFLTHGQHTPGLVVALTPEQAKLYVQEVSELWGKRHRVEDLVKCWLEDDDGGGHYYYLVVIFGHRRYKGTELATRIMKQPSFAEEFPNSTFDGKYLCEIHFGLTVEQAIGLQFSENRYVPIALHEEVRAASMAWRFLRKRDPSLTQSAFAKTIARSPGWVLNMLRFTSLPERVQKLIEPEAGEYDELAERQFNVPFRLLVEEARYVEALREHGREISEDDILHRVLGLIVRQVRPKEYGKEISTRIQEMRSGQGDLLLESGEEQSLRKVAVPHLIEAIHAALGYWRSIETLRQAGAFGIESPFAPLDPRELGEYSMQSPIRMALKNTRVLMGVVPHLITYARRDKRGRRKLEKAFEQLSVAEAVFSVLEEKS